MEKNKYIFVDLDETLIHCNPWNDEPVENSKVITLERNDTYRAVLRPGALELLKALRAIAPCYILTAAVQDYAEGWNKVFELGFDEFEIYHRKDIADRVIGKSKFPNAQTYLIDNLPRHENRSKIEFLREVDSVPKYFNIKPYYGYETQDVTADMIQEIVTFVTE
jgi:hypothetical protein